MINDTLARTLFGDTDPLGRRVALCPQMSSRSPRWLEVVGVVTSMRSNGLRREMPAELFLPLGQGPADSTMTLVVQSREPLDQLAPAVRKMVRDFDPFVPVFAVRSLDDVVAGDRALARWLMELFVALGAVGLLLAVIGVYGVVSYFVSQRAHEIGVRIAIGASRSQVISLVLRQGCGVALCGIAIGVIAAAGSARILDAVLFGVTSHDWLTFAVVTLVLLGAVLLAIAVPARRAARLDPIVTLRS
jgi:putative ABC transport system permease protein